MKFSTRPPIGSGSGREKYRMERLKHGSSFVLLRFCSSDDIVLTLVIVGIYNPHVVKCRWGASNAYVSVRVYMRLIDAGDV